MKRLLATVSISISLLAAPGAALSLGVGQQPTADGARDVDREAERVVQEAFRAFRAGRYAALEPHLTALRNVLDRAPAGSRNSVYPSAAMILGSYAFEYRRYAEALEVLDRGLALQPDGPGLLMERGNALMALGRPNDALGSLEAGLSSSRLRDDVLRARLLRGRGVILIDLQRLNDAEASLNASLQLEPGNAAALNELRHIAALRQGGEATPTQPQDQNTDQPTASKRAA